MVGKAPLQYWEIWYPNAAATGLLIARGLIDPADEIIFHSPPDVLSVKVSDQNGGLVASGENLRRTLESPMCRLARSGNSITRQDLWPTADDYGKVVLLPGGEAGILQSWWNSEDKKEWRWQIEFYNSLRHEGD